LHLRSDFGSSLCFSLGSSSHFPSGDDFPLPPPHSCIFLFLGSLVSGSFGEPTQNLGVGAPLRHFFPKGGGGLVTIPPTPSGGSFHRQGFPIFVGWEVWGSRGVSFSLNFWSSLYQIFLRFPFTPNPLFSFFFFRATIAFTFSPCFWAQKTFPYNLPPFSEGLFSHFFFMDDVKVASTWPGWRSHKLLQWFLFSTFFLIFSDG